MENNSIVVVYILHVLNNSGSIISFKNLLPELVKHGVKPVVIVPNDKHADHKVRAELETLGCECYSCNVDKSAYYNDKNIIKRIYHNLPILPKRVLARRDIERIIERINPDIVHTISGITQEGYWVAKQRNIPHVWHIREYLTLDFGKKLFPSEKKVKEMYADSYTICITHDLQRYFELEGNENSKVIYNPIFPLDKIDGVNYTKKRYFLISSRISREKGIEAIMDAFVEVCKSKTDVVLQIAGFGTDQYMAYLKDKYAAQINENRIIFLGFVKDIRGLMKEALALLVGSTYEGFGRMTAEANMLGCPVIGRNTAGTKEILEFTGGGFLFDTQEELLKKMIALCEMSQNDIQSMMRQAQVRAIKEYNSEHSADQVYSFYNRIIT